MALHEIPDDGVKHLPGKGCPCQPTSHKRRDRGIVRTVYTHHEVPTDSRLVAEMAPAVEAPETECGHQVVDVGGELQHHEIPDDGHPHAPTTECGCGPQREQQNGHVVYVHADQGHDEQTEQLYREVFGV